jgi:hypothetical protein
MMDDDLKAIRDNIATLSDDELERMVTVEAGDYRPQAIELARRELEARGISVSPRGTGPGKQSERAAERTASSGEEAEEGPREAADEEHSSRLLCPFCNGPVRRAALLGDNEIIALFRDNDEQRYVDVFVCTRCGEARLVVDLVTPVTEE